MCEWESGREIVLESSKKIVGNDGGVDETKGGERGGREASREARQLSEWRSKVWELTGNTGSQWTRRGIAFDISGTRLIVAGKVGTVDVWKSL